MTNPSDALALPAENPGPIAVLPPPPSFGFCAFPSPIQAEQPSVLWQALTRHYKLLSLFAMLCVGVAYQAGQAFGRPTWQAETTLICQAVTFTPQQLAVYQDSPNITTLASMVCEPAVIEQLGREFNLGENVDDFIAKNVKVNQPTGTQLIVVSLSARDRDAAATMLTRFCALFCDFVVVNRKVTILRKSLIATQQLSAVARNECERLKRQIRDLEAQLARTGRLPDIDPDGSLAIRRGTLVSEIRKAEDLIEELHMEEAGHEAEINRIRGPVREGAYAQAALRELEQKLTIVQIRIKNNEEKIKIDREELRRLPIVLAQGKVFSEESKAKDAAEQIEQLKADLLTIGRPGGPPATGLLEGMDARELTVKSPARVGDKPLTTTKRSIALYTFVGLMGCFFGLVLAYDRFVSPPPKPKAAPAAEASTHRDPIRTSVVQVEHRNGHTEKLTVAQVETKRLRVRIDQWIRSGPDSVNSLSALMLSPDGGYQETPPPAGHEHEARHMTTRIHQWLEKGSAEPPPDSHLS